MKFTKKEDRENINRFNRISGTSHRSKPYDFNNSEDIIEATVMATAEFIDISSYQSSLVAIEEAFDESLEYFEPAAWIKIGLEGSTEDHHIDDARENLQDATDNFQTLLDICEGKCLVMWKMVLFNSPEEVVKHFFGEVIEVEERIIDEVFEKRIFDILDNIDYDRFMENSVQSFAANLKSALLEVKEENE